MSVKIVSEKIRGPKAFTIKLTILSRLSRVVQANGALAVRSLTVGRADAERCG